MTITTSASDAAVVHALLEPGAVTVAYQPIVAIDGRAVVGWEALARMRHDTELPPDAAIDLARSFGLANELELACLDAVAAGGPVPGGAALFVNCGIELLLDDRAEARLAALVALGPGLVVEVTEATVAAEPGRLLDRLAAWGGLGVRFAVDDTGSGYSSLRRVVDLEPRYVKLDASLVHGLADDARLRAVLAAMLTFTEAMGAELVAEGVERRADLAVLADAGVPYAQGFLLGRPGPARTAIVDLA